MILLPVRSRGAVVSVLQLHQVIRLAMSDSASVVQERGLMRPSARPSHGFAPSSQTLLTLSAKIADVLEGILATDLAGIGC